MARVTVEDCLDNVDNRFELVMLATKRARQLATGGKEPKVAWENDKPTVVALRGSLPAWSMRTSSSRKTSSRTNRCSQRSTTRPTPRPCKPWPRLDVACERRNPPTGRG